MTGSSLSLLARSLRFRPNASSAGVWLLRAPAAAGRAAPGPGRSLQIVLEPSFAFGTGDHPTTCACLARLGDYFADRGGGANCLDIGSGTGVLAIAAWLWGAARVEGYDIDGASIQNAYLNADLNGLAGRLRFRWGEPGSGALAGGAWDLLLSNLYLDPILRLLPRFDAALAPGGHAILSGFLPEQAEAIRRAALGRGWRPAPRGETESEGWMLQEWQKA